MQLHTASIITATLAPYTLQYYKMLQMLNYQANNSDIYH